MDRIEVFENIDRLLQVEIRPAGLPMGVVPALYEHARDGGEPLSLRVARHLSAPEIGRVALLTGVVMPSIPNGEVDGPIGASVLAAALTTLGRAATVVVPEPMLRVAAAVRSALRADFEIAADGAVGPGDFDAAVAIERLGRNRAGRHHTIYGAPIELGDTADDLVEEMTTAGKLTIGFGDGGNEIGFGALYDAAREIVPNGRDCGCPCGDGLVTATATTLVFPVSVSNFGAYATAASLGLLSDRPALLPQTRLLEDAIMAALAEGALDGGTFQPGFVGDDGIPFETIAAVVGVLRGICLQSFRTSPRHA